MQALVDPTNIDRTINEVAQIYRALTGTEVEHDPKRGEIPPEQDPVLFVSDRLTQLRQMLGMQPSVMPGAAQMPGTTAMPTWAPPVDLLESEQEIVIAIDLPGVKQDELSVTTIDHMLVVKGERRPFGLGNGVVPRGIERVFGPFQRLVTLPAGARLDSVDARFQDGVLTIHIARESTAPRVKKLEVRETNERRVKQ